jgi:dUTP pyrophosphatase
MKNGVFVLNAPGIIDPSYRGNVGVILHNASQRQFTIHKNDRIAQILFMEYETPNFLTDGGEDFDSDSTERGSNGFGSSGVK